jgi:hypothetical protein
MSLAYVWNSGYPAKRDGGIVQPCPCRVRASITTRRDMACRVTDHVAVPPGERDRGLVAAAGRASFYRVAQRVSNHWWVTRAGNCFCSRGRPGTGQLGKL